MAQGSRPERVGEQIRQELSQIISQQVHDPGIGLLTISRVKVTPDLQLARVLYTVLGDEKQKKETQKALERAIPFMRRQIASRMRLRRVPELQFFYDQAIEHQDRIEQILIDLKREREANPVDTDPGAPAPDSLPSVDPDDADGA
jgi:ribosome-binding factor A